MFIITYSLKDTDKNRDIYARTCTLSQYRKTIDRKRLFESKTWNEELAIKEFENENTDCNILEIEEV